MNWKGVKVIVTGGDGMIGKELVEQLEKLKANVYKVDNKIHRFHNVLHKESMEVLFEKMKPEIVFHLFGIKGSPKMTKERPVDFMYPMLVGDANIIYMAQKYGVKRFLYTSSIAVENPESDKYPAWAKMTGENLIEAMRVQYPKGTEFVIVRPANVYGRYDNFDREDSMVITSLIKKGLNDKQIKLMTDGTEIRDFINAKDVARGMIKAMEEMPNEPVNLCSGKGIKIEKIANLIGKEFNKKVTYNMNKADVHSRVMTNNFKGFKPEINIEGGVKEVIQYATRKRT